MTAARQQVDHHTHLLSPSLAAMLSDAGLAVRTRTADELVAVLDVDGFDAAVVLSTAYMFAALEGPSEHATAVQSDNDWTAEQVAAYPGRLVAYLSVNPLDADATDEIARCAATQNFVGLKLHLASAGVDLRDPDHRCRIADVIACAAEHDLAITVHLRTRHPDFGRLDTELFLNEIAPTAPTVPIQVAHVGGWGGYDDATDDALQAIITAAPGLPNLYVDIAAVTIGAHATDQKTGTLRRRLTELAATSERPRILFGTDWPIFTPRDYQATFMNETALTRADLDALFEPDLLTTRNRDDRSRR